MRKSAEILVRLASRKLRLELAYLQDIKPEFYRYTTCGTFTFVYFIDREIYVQKKTNNVGNWKKVDQLDVTRFIISPFTAQHVCDSHT